MRRYWRVYRAFFTTSFARELEFRANFFAKILYNMVWMFFFVMVLMVIYRNADSVAGWTRGEAFILAATCFLMNAVVSAFFQSLMEIPEQVRKGTLDFAITKPIDSQFWVSSRRFNFDRIGMLLAGVAMMAIGVYSSNLHPGVVQWLAYVLLVGAAIAIFYCFNLLLMTLGVWLVRVDNLWVLGETVMEVARYPMDIFPNALQRFFTYTLPLAFLASIPARQLVDGLDPTMVALGACWAAVFLLAARGFWRFAMRHYSSASS